MGNAPNRPLSRLVGRRHVQEARDHVGIWRHIGIDPRQPAAHPDWAASETRRVGHRHGPKDALGQVARAMGVTGLLDNAIIKWGGGGDVQQGESLLYFKSYEKGREKWQGPTIDGVWFDEEAPLEIYTEGLTRTNNGQRGQFAIMTFTPLQGMSEVVRMFLTPQMVERLTK